ncbi:MAG: hypothetical protein JOZ18_07555 [Chloroflexi bacterium]|nr:hypothetical protein [Chloroflexota bacterium]
MKRFIFVLLVLFSLAWSACGSASAPGTAPIPTATRVLTSHYTARLSALNSSGVSGTVDFQITGNVLVVKMDVTGLVPNQKHFQHIHGDGTSTCPTATDAKNGVTLSEALTNIGPLAFDLQPYPLTGAQGRLNLTQTFTLDPDELANITPLTGHVMVFHGAFNHGQYDRFLPAACGPILAA